MVVLVSGAAGFIGYHLCRALINNKKEVIGFDNINDYYDQNLKRDRIKNLNKLASELSGNFNFFKCDLSNKRI